MISSTYACIPSRDRVRAPHAPTALISSTYAFFTSRTPLTRPKSYLTSTASGEELTNGPKPFEDEGSSSPIDAQGYFNYAGWWAK